MSGGTFSAAKPRVLLTDPGDERIIQVTKHLDTLRPVIRSVEVHPAAYRRVNEASEVFQALVATDPGHPPFANGPAHLSGCFGAHRWKEANKMFPPTILRSTRLKGETEEVEFDVFVLLSAIIVLAVHELRLRRMKLEVALLEPRSNALQHKLRLCLTHAVDDRIVRKTLEGDWRKFPLHPRKLP